MESPNTLGARRAIWAAIQAAAPARGIDPGFVYAIVKLESNFDPHARNGDARGLMQIKPRAWRTVSTLPYETNVWNWRTNLNVGLDGLAANKRALEAKGVFSYRLLWASYHFGYDFVAARGFDMGRIPRPSDALSRHLWDGDPRPVRPPN